MDKNIAYRKLLSKAKILLEEASNKLTDLVILRKKLRQDSIQKDYHEQILSINANVESDILKGYLLNQNSILENQIKFDNKQKEISSLICFVLLNTLQVMDKSLDDSEIESITKDRSKTLFYYCIEFIENNKINKIIDFSSVMQIIIALDYKVAEADSIDKRNIQRRLAKLKKIIIGIE